MDINRGNMDAFFQDLKVLFTDAMQQGQADQILTKCAMMVPSTGASTIHGWLNQIPNLREWVGDRLVNNIQSGKLEVTNKKYESTVEIPREDLEDDAQGLYRPLASLMGRNAAIFPDDLLATALCTNDNWAGDSAAFYGTSRVYGSSTISNYTTSALSASTFRTAIQTVQEYTGHNGEPLMAQPFALVCGPSKRVTAWNILKNTKVGGYDATGPIDNPDQGLVELVISPRLVGTYDDYWFILSQVGGIKGLIWQLRKAAEFQTSRTSDDSDFVFEQDKYQFGVRMRGAAFKALPHLIYAGIL